MLIRGSGDPLRNDVRACEGEVNGTSWAEQLQMLDR